MRLQQAKETINRPLVFLSLLDCRDWLIIILRKFKPFKSKPLPKLVPGTVFAISDGLSIFLCYKCLNRSRAWRVISFSHIPDIRVPPCCVHITLGFLTFICIAGIGEAEKVNVVLFASAYELVLVVTHSLEALMGPSGLNWWTKQVIHWAGKQRWRLFLPPELLGVSLLLWVQTWVSSVCHHLNSPTGYFFVLEQITILLNTPYQTAASASKV